MPDVKELGQLLSSIFSRLSFTIRILRGTTWRFAREESSYYGHRQLYFATTTDALHRKRISRRNILKFARHERVARCFHFFVSTTSFNSFLQTLTGDKS